MFRFCAFLGILTIGCGLASQPSAYTPEQQRCLDLAIQDTVREYEAVGIRAEVADLGPHDLEGKYLGPDTMTFRLAVRGKLIPPAERQPRVAEDVYPKSRFGHQNQSELILSGRWTALVAVKKSTGQGCFLRTNPLQEWLMGELAGRRAQYGKEEVYPPSPRWEGGSGLKPEGIHD